MSKPVRGTEGEAFCNTNGCHGWRKRSYFVYMLICKGRTNHIRKCRLTLYTHILTHTHTHTYTHIHTCTYTHTHTHTHTHFLPHPMLNLPHTILDSLHSNYAHNVANYVVFCELNELTCHRLSQGRRPAPPCWRQGQGTWCHYWHLDGSRSKKYLQSVGEKRGKEGERERERKSAVKAKYVKTIGSYKFLTWACLGALTSTLTINSQLYSCTDPKRHSHINMPPTHTHCPSQQDPINIIHHTANKPFMYES